MKRLHKDPRVIQNVLGDAGATPAEITAFTRSQNAAHMQAVLHEIAKNTGITAQAITHRLALAQGILPNTIDTSDADAA